MPLRDLLADLADDIFSLDNRLVRTLWLLLRRPGRLTNEYLDGRRVAYVPPLRLYLIVSAFHFLVLALSDSGTYFFFRASGDNAQLARFVEALPKLMFLILPLFAVLLKGLYHRTGRLYMEHLIFALHFHAFAFLVLSGHTLLDPLVQAARAGGGVVAVLMVMMLLVDGVLQLAVPVYLYLALRRVYHQGRRITAGKTLALFLSYFSLLIFAGFVLIQGMRLAARFG